MWDKLSKLLSFVKLVRNNLRMGQIGGTQFVPNIGQIERLGFEELANLPDTDDSLSFKLGFLMLL